MVCHNLILHLYPLVFLHLSISFSISILEIYFTHLLPCYIWIFVAACHNLSPVCTHKEELFRICSNAYKTEKSLINTANHHSNSFLLLQKSSVAPYSKACTSHGALSHVCRKCSHDKMYYCCFFSGQPENPWLELLFSECTAKSELRQKEQNPGNTDNGNV